MQRSVQRKQRGIALVMVLWVLILLGLVAASFLRETRLSTGIARNASENAKAEALAEAGIQRAMLGLADSDVTAWRLDGTPYQFALGDGTVVVRIQDEGGKVDLNLAPPPLLQGLLQINGVEANAARNLLDAIVDFRDPDSNRLPGGAEDPEYAAAGRDGGAKDAPFDASDREERVAGTTGPAVDGHPGHEGIQPAADQGALGAADELGDAQAGHGDPPPGACPRPVRNSRATSRSSNGHTSVPMI